MEHSSVQTRTDRGAIARAVNVVASARGATAAHYLSLLAGLVVLVYLCRNQWFFYDEWAFVWNPGAELWAGHGGHWSTIPILVWMAIQGVWGLGSYAPFIFVELIVHLVTAHLLWRLMRRAGCAPWVATLSAGVFIFLGAGSENILWAFQFAYIGAVTCALGALLIAMSPVLTRGRGLAITALLLAGVATSGTALAFLIPVAAMLWILHGWRQMLLWTAPVLIVYVIWLTLIAGPNPNAPLRATGTEVFLTPAFAGAMYVRGLEVFIPIPFIGLLITAALGIAAILMLRRRLGAPALATLGLLAGGIAFSFLTAYSRWGTGLAAASSGRYLYLIVLSILPLSALLLTQAARAGRWSAAIVVVAVVAVGAYNLGLLVHNARAEAARETVTHEVTSAGIAMLQQYPDATNPNVTPEPTFLPIITVGQLDALHRQQGLTTIPYSPRSWLTAVVNAGLAVGPGSSESGACDAVAPGSLLASGVTVSTGAAAEVTVAAVDAAGERGDSRVIPLQPGATTLTAAADTPVVVIAVTPGTELCTIERRP